MKFCALLLVILAGCAAPREALRSVVLQEAPKRLKVEQSFGNFSSASAVSLDEFGAIYVIDRGRSSILKFNSYGDSLRSISGTGREHYQFDAPIDLDARLTNALVIADYANHRVERYSRDLAYVSTLETRNSGRQESRFGYPRAVRADQAGNLFVLDGENHRVLKFRYDYTFERSIGSYTDATRGDGVLRDPKSLAVDGLGNLIVLDGASDLIAYDPFGNVLHRERLSGTVRALASTDDTLFVLARMQGESVDRIQLRRSVDLVQFQSWVLPADRREECTAIAVRNGSIVLLTPIHALRCARMEQ